ncbi:response regulator transcription factor [Stenotrophomonas sp.]|uniref:response regulator transcription factor n=1 Tax=Stenotrophomonas sp. TaxID=69392 RepID=UPI0028A8DB7C|nr:response regulator transcription factor [Stenotrophomonas sp.]
MTENNVRVLVVDDHPVLRAGVSALFEDRTDITIVGEADNGHDALLQFRALKPDVVLMDLQMPGSNGLEGITSIRAEFPDARIIVLTTYQGDASAVAALKAGAMGYLLKSGLRTELADAVLNVSRGKRHVHREVADEIALHVGDGMLTDREVAILRLVANGKANKQIGSELNLTEATVKGHLKSIFAKLGVADRTHAVTIAARRGIIDL